MTRSQQEATSTLDIISHSSAQTERLGMRLGELLHGGELILLDGQLGTGKTTFTQGLARGMGITEIVSSPTFTLLKEYQGQPVSIMEPRQNTLPQQPSSQHPGSELVSIIFKFLIEQLVKVINKSHYIDVKYSRKTQKKSASFLGNVRLLVKTLKHETHYSTFPVFDWSRNLQWPEERPTTADASAWPL